MRIVISKNSDAVAEYVSNYIIERIKAHNSDNSDGIQNNQNCRPFVLGLPTGGTPIKTYQALIKAYRQGLISFKNVVTFNMDEYVGLPRSHPESYYSFMFNNLFNFIDIPKENVNILNGNATDLIRECSLYEEKIAKYGGIDLFIGGLGSDGHIAFNEPGSSLSSLTRVKSLNDETVEANARFFNNDIKQVPTMAVTVGVQTIMNAKEVLIIATGINKAVAVEQMVQGPVSHSFPCTALQFHQSLVLCIDEDATHELKVKTVKYFKGLTKSEKAMEERQKKLRRSKI